MRRKHCQRERRKINKLSPSSINILDDFVLRRLLMLLAQRKLGRFWRNHTKGIE
jgi:hypothetical protein